MYVSVTTKIELFPDKLPVELGILWNRNDIIIY